MIKSWVLPSSSSIFHLIVPSPFISNHPLIPFILLNLADRSGPMKWLILFDMVQLEKVSMPISNESLSKAQDRGLQLWAASASSWVASKAWWLLGRHRSLYCGLYCLLNHLLDVGIHDSSKKLFLLASSPNDGKLSVDANLGRTWLEILSYDRPWLLEDVVAKVRVCVSSLLPWLPYWW